MARLDKTGWNVPALRLSAVLVLLLVVVDVVAIVGIVGTRRAARQAALEELQRRAEVQARGCEAALATLRADLLFLAGSPRLGEVWERSRSQDPLAGRWARLETESTLLQFMAGHGGLVSLTAGGPGHDGDETSIRVVRAAGGVPSLAEDAAPSGESASPAGFVFELDLTEGGAGLPLRATVDPQRLLESVSPGLGGALVLLPQSSGPSQASELTVSEPIDARGFEVAGPVVLERREQAGRLVGAVETLASRYRTTVLLNVVVLLLAVPLGLLAVREARRVERLTSAAEHEKQRREMERQVWHQERLATLGRLTADLAHEVNNPLAGVANHLSLLEEEVTAGETDAAARRLPKLRHGLERISEIVRRALRLANPGEMGREPVDLQGVVRESVALLVDETAQVELRLPDPGAEPVVVEGEAAALVQVVTNLVLNAVQIQQSQNEKDPSLDRRGEVTIDVRREGGEALLEVADRGPGIPEEIAARLFEPFVSGRGSTGLGLSVCHGIVSRHGGRIEASTRPGGGARFVVRLPLLEDMAAPQASGLGGLAS